MKRFVLIIALLMTTTLYAEDMGKVLIVYKPDKTVSVIHPIQDTRKDGESLDTFFYRIYLDATVGNELYGLPYDVLDTSDLPNREDRESWEGVEGEGVLTNTIKKAKKVKAKNRKKLIKERADQIANTQAEAELIAEGKIDE